MTTQKVSQGLRVEQVIVIGALLFGLVAWWFAYVIPHDNTRSQIMACMGHDPTRAAYLRCAEKLKEGSTQSR